MADSSAEAAGKKAMALITGCVFLTFFVLDRLLTRLFFTPFPILDTKAFIDLGHWRSGRLSLSIRVPLALLLLVACHTLLCFLASRYVKKSLELRSFAALLPAVAVSLAVVLGPLQLILELAIGHFGMINLGRLAAVHFFLVLRDMVYVVVLGLLTRRIIRGSSGWVNWSYLLKAFGLAVTAGAIIAFVLMSASESLSNRGLLSLTWSTIDSLWKMLFFLLSFGLYPNDGPAHVADGHSASARP